MLPDSPTPATEAPRDCPPCPRLVAARHPRRAARVACRQARRGEHPEGWNSPVPNFGDPGAWLAICGLAPGKQGANRTGRPFTGDLAGLLLSERLLTFGP